MRTTTPNEMSDVAKAIIAKNRKSALATAKAANERAARAKASTKATKKSLQKVAKPKNAPKGTKEAAKEAIAATTASIKKTKAEKAEAAIRDVAATDVELATNIAPSIELNTELQTAFDFFNRKLFASKLAPVMFSNVRLKKSLGHHWPKAWARRAELKGKVDEIGMDFTRLREQGQGDKEVLSTLVHEMCHQLVAMLPGKPERGHGHKWVAAMHLVGLEPIILNAKGQPTGKPTGPNASHRIVEGGVFDAAATELLATGLKFSWFSEPVAQPEKKPGKKKKAGAKAKHTCPCCQRNAWGAPSLHLFCKGDPETEHELTEMDCDRTQYDDTSESDGG